MFKHCHFYELMGVVTHLINLNWLDYIIDPLMLVLYGVIVLFPTLSALLGC
jgi:hypothetical protein